jgi:hypothetical protein
LAMVRSAMVVSCMKPLPSLSYVLDLATKLSS